MGLDDFIRDVADTVKGRRQQDQPEEEGQDRQEGVVERVVDAVTGRERDRNERNIRPASEDPLGDPADQPYRREDRYVGNEGTRRAGGPYGRNEEEETAAERASERYGRDVRPASEDPLGDPADQEEDRGPFRR